MGEVKDKKPIHSTNLKDSEATGKAHQGSCFPDGLFSFCLFSFIYMFYGENNSLRKQSSPSSFNKRYWIYLSSSFSLLLPENSSPAHKGTGALLPQLREGNAQPGQGDGDLGQ